MTKTDELLATASAYEMARGLLRLEEMIEAVQHGQPHLLSRSECLRRVLLLLDPARVGAQS